MDKNDCVRDAIQVIGRFCSSQDSCVGCRFYIRPLVECLFEHDPEIWIDKLCEYEKLFGR